jgi:flagellar motor switch protein FliN/FliY
MIVDQSEIDALLAQADGLAAEAQIEVTAPEPPQAPKPVRIEAGSPEVARILKLRVPVIVRLASRRMTISAVRRLSLGMIIEFQKPVEQPLELLINNHSIGKGDAVKVNEHFGLRVREIGDAATRIRSMGRSPS